MDVYGELVSQIRKMHPYIIGNVSIWPTKITIICYFCGHIQESTNHMFPSVHTLTCIWMHARMFNEHANNVN